MIQRLLIAVGLLAILGVGIYFSDKAKKEEEKKGPTDTPKILSIPEDQLSRISIQRKDGKNTTLNKGDKWQITAPETLGVDQDAVTSMTGAVASMTADRIVEENAADLAPFGLNDPLVQVSITKKDGKVTKLLIGSETATGSGFFAKLEGEAKVYTIGSFNKTSFDKTAQDLRDKRLVAFDGDKLTRVELAAKGAPVEFGKNSSNEWGIVKPKPARADNFAVEELVRKIKDAKMDTSVSDDDAKKAAANFASGTKIAVARMTDSAGTHEFEIRRKDKDYFAKGSAIAGFFKVGNDLGDGVNKGMDDFRNKKLFDFGFSDPTKLEVKIDNDSKVYQKSDDKWKRGNDEMDSVSVQSFVDKLRDLAAVSFAETGFKAAVVEVKLTAKEGKLVDHVLISTAANGYVAIRNNEPTVYVLPPNVVEELKRAAADIKAPVKETKKDEKKK